MGEPLGCCQFRDALKKQMNVLQVLVGILTTSCLVSISTYWATGSIGWAIISPIVLQIGYFVYMLWTVYGAEAAEADPGPESVGPLDRKDGIWL